MHKKFELNTVKLVLVYFFMKFQFTCIRNEMHKTKIPEIFNVKMDLFGTINQIMNADQLNEILVGGVEARVACL